MENMIKIMSYITKINKSKKEMNNIFQELMRNIKISYNEEKNSKKKMKNIILMEYLNLIILNLKI